MSFTDNTTGKFEWATPHIATAYKPYPFPSLWDRLMKKPLPISIKSTDDAGIVLEFAALNRAQMIELACRRVIAKYPTMLSIAKSLMMIEPFLPADLHPVQAESLLRKHVLQEYHTLCTQLAHATT